MRKLLSMVLIPAILTASAPLAALAAARESVDLVGTTYTSNLQPLPRASVQIRNLKTGMRVNSTVSDADGDFAFPGLPPDAYIIEVLDSTGKVLGMSAPFTLGSAPTVNVSVVAVAHGLASENNSGGGGFSLFGLGPASSLAVLGAAGAAGVTAVVATRQNASPSR